MARPTRRVRVDMQEILDAMSSGPDEGVTELLDLQEGTVRWLVDIEVSGVEDEELSREVEEDPKRFVEIPRSTADEYDLMVRFAASLDEDDIRDRLEIALRGKGAFARFRDVVFPYPDLKARWLDLRQQALAKQAVAWLQSLDIEPEYELPPAAGPAAPAKTAPAKIELLDLLLLGAPGGKTELIDGRVRRTVALASETDARGAFRGLARELAGWFGLEWRKRFVDGKSQFDVERAHLSVEGHDVTLEIEVTSETWRRFGG